jgi:HK97 gp10 family phage protein
MENDHLRGDLFMSVEVDFSGLDRQFAELARKTKSGGKKAAKVGAEIVAAKLKENTPVEDKSDRKWKQQREVEREKGTSREFKHMKDDIVISRADDLGEYNVHYGKDTAWRSHFVNDGTINQSAQHFVEKTVDETKESVRVEMQAIVNKELSSL